MNIAELVALNNEDFLHEAYNLVLGREIDNSGLEGYRKKLAAGRSKQWVLAALARSKEAQNRFAPPALLELSEEAFVDAAYVQLLGRNADAEGMRHYLDQLAKHGDRVKVLRTIGGSQEARRTDPVGWAFRRELNDLIRRESSLLGWRKLLPKSRGGGFSPRRSSPVEFDVLAKQMLHAQREENAVLKDQVILLASAVEGLAAAQKRDAARIDELLAAITEAGKPRLI